MRSTRSEQVHRSCARSIETGVEHPLTPPLARGGAHRHSISHPHVTPVRVPIPMTGAIHTDVNQINSMENTLEAQDTIMNVHEERNSFIASPAPTFDTEVLDNQQVFFSFQFVWYKLVAIVYFEIVLTL